MDLSFPRRPFHSKGGANVPHRKNTAHMESVFMPPPDKIILPMQQHIGAICTPTVKKGDYVYAGQVIGNSEAYVSAPIHASVSGTVADITQITMTGGQKIDAVVIESDGKMEFEPSIQPPAEIKTKKELDEATWNAGLVGLGGAGFPSHVKLNVKDESKIDTLIINVAECEPYVTADHREALENGENVLLGIYKVKEILGVKRVFIAVEENKPDAIVKLTEIADNPELDPNDEVRVIKLKSRYPQGAEKILIKVCTNRVVPEGGLPSDVGCIVMNIASVAFISTFIKNGKPLTLKRVSIDGSAIKNPQNVIVPIGTKISDIVEFCGGYKTEPKKIMLGGPMMGTALTTDDFPIIKQNNAVLFFDEKDANLMKTTACIRCARCYMACPLSLRPRDFEMASDSKDLEKLKDLHIMNCMECGCCSYACPAGRKLVHAIRVGKNHLRTGGAK